MPRRTIYPKGKFTNSELGEFLVENKKTGLQLLGKEDTSRRFKKAVKAGKMEVMKGRLLK